MSSGRWLIPLLLVALAPFAWSSGWREDELACLADALRVQGGEALYRDFFAFAAPLSYWLAAGLFALTGASLLAARLLLVACLTASGWLVYRLASRRGSGEALAALAALAVVYGTFRPYPAWSHHWIALPLTLAALLLATEASDAPRSRRWLAAGACAALALLTTQTDGIMTFALLGTGLTALGLLGPFSPREAAGAAGRVAAGAALVALPVLLVFLAQGALDDAWRCTWEWPRAHYKLAGGTNDVLVGHDLGPYISPTNGPWPGRLGFWARLYHGVGLFVIMGLAAATGLLTALGLVAERLRAGRPLDAERARDGWLAIAACACLALACKGRADYIHMAFYAPVAFAVMAVLGGRLRAPLAAAAGPFAPALPALALGGFVLAGAGLVAVEVRQHPDQWLDARTPDARLRASEAVRYIQAHTVPGDRIVALPMGSFHNFYGRPSASDMSVMLPLRFRYTAEADYQALGARIRERRPALILVTPDHPDPRELVEHLRFPLDGYAPAGTVMTPPTTGEPRKTWIFRRVDAQ